MGGLGVLFFVGLYFLIAYKVTKAVGSKWFKAVVIIVALLIPTADAIYGRIKLKRMCEAEAGLRVYRVAEHVKGVADETTSYASAEYWVGEQGYQFSERTAPIAGKVDRFFRGADGLVSLEKSVLPKSEYRLRRIYPDWKTTYARDVFLIENIATGEVLATQTWLAFNGGWAERFLAKFSDAGGGNVAHCSNVPDFGYHNHKLVNNILKH